jgi:hypothetical protein
VPNARRPFRVSFVPGFAPGMAHDRSDGVTFELRAGEHVRFRHHQLGAEPEREVTLRVVDGLAHERMTLDLLVGAGPFQNAVHDRALWRGLRVYVEGVATPARGESRERREAVGESGEDGAPRAQPDPPAAVEPTEETILH